MNTGASSGFAQDIDDLWDYQQPAESEARFRQALAQSAPRSEYYIELLTQIARAQGLQRNFVAAHATLDAAVELLTASYRRAPLRILLERGRLYNSDGDRAQARPFFLQAWEQAQAADEDFFAVDAAHMLGIVEPPDQQLMWNLRAMEMAEHSANPRTRRWLGSLYNNIGWSYHELGRDEEALVTFEKALTWRKEAGQSREIRIAHWCVGRILRALGRTEEALAVQRQLAEEWAATGTSDGYVDEELGECLLALHRPDEAAPHFTRAYELLSQDPWLVANEPHRLKRLATLGQSPPQN
ncbi:MAG: hypothetical protein DCC55_02715 [Chloroflexi bacterium]|nr:MAG: hypothetical protein DCC55_02715 [Chloroflexota bacterium]